MDTWKQNLAIVALLSVVSGCSMVKESLTRYQEPTDGPRARLRFVGFDPSLYSSDHADINAKPAGRVTDHLSWGLGKRDLGIPKRNGFDADFTEFYVRAGAPVTVLFKINVPVASPGYQVVGGGTSICPGATLSRSFVPCQGHDYEAREVYHRTPYGQCAEAELFAVKTVGGVVKETPIPLAGTRCPAP